MNLINNHTFNLQEPPTKEDTIIPTKMVFKEKSTINGNLEKLKSRCCSRGDLENKEINQKTGQVVLVKEQ